jgi:hypothetical protein
MRPMARHGDEQLLRLESAIAAFKTRPAMEQSRKGHLLAALERERAAVMSASARLRSGNSRLRALVQSSDQTA